MKRDHGWMIAIVVVGCALTIGWGERIGVHHGEGWDGQAYTAWAIDLPAMIDHVNAFQAQRVLPSALVYGALGGLGIARTIPHVIAGFQFLDALALLASVVLMVRIAVLLGWSRAASWVAFAATMLGFANARHALYYPTLTDPLAFALAMAVVWAYLARRPLVLWLVTLAAAFTWPALVALGSTLLVLPRTTAELPATPVSRKLPVAIAVAAAALLVALFVDVLGAPEPEIDRWLVRSHHALWIPTIAITVLTSAAAAYVVARRDRTFSVRAYLAGVGGRRLALGGVGIAAIVAVRMAWIAAVATSEYSFGVRELEFYSLAVAVRGPLWNVVHQIVYFGPIVLVAIAGWPKLAELAASWGPGAVLGLGFVVLASVSPDARHVLHLMPLAIVVAVTATAAWWTPRRAIGFAVLALAWSKLWLPIGYDQPHDSLAWPDLRYFMQQAAWASDATYLAHLAAAIVTAGLLWLIVRRL